ncbi:hypothetical protein PHMEG_00023551 [Phytophthora megakarya]|uniref:Uncharacterized protein n=1 Tax=Phytophthora megakarya TaxID=4795 RepID=A0A225VIC9_9STRA|nr:hypothetical protein PHMEG_00023551 [Phytophthora megakarya]
MVPSDSADHKWNVDDWNAFVRNESQQAMKSTHMEWCDGNILIVEFPSREHSIFCTEFDMSINANDHFRRHLNTYRDAYVETTDRRLEPDASFGPRIAPLPAGIQEYGDWHTLKVEVGCSRRWGDSPGQLDWKANQWTTFPGVRYVLCVAVWPRLARAEYKLYMVQGLNIRLDPQAPIPVVNPTPVVFDSRALLGLEPLDVLPPGFADTFTIDLYEVLTEARERGMY